MPGNEPKHEDQPHEGYEAPEAEDLDTDHGPVAAAAGFNGSPPPDTTTPG
jgi:hypothetical protein